MTTDTVTSARLTVIDIAIRSHRARQIEAQHHGSPIVAEFFADRIDTLLGERQRITTENDAHDTAAAT